MRASVSHGGGAGRKKARAAGVQPKGGRERRPPAWAHLYLRTCASVWQRLDRRLSAWRSERKHAASGHRQRAFAPYIRSTVYMSWTGRNPRCSYAVSVRVWSTAACYCASIARSTCYSTNSVLRALQQQFAVLFARPPCSIALSLDASPPERGGQLTEMTFCNLC